MTDQTPTWGDLIRDYTNRVNEAYNQRAATMRCQTVRHGACAPHQSFCTCNCHGDNQ